MAARRNKYICLSNKMASTKQKREKVQENTKRQQTVAVMFSIHTRGQTQILHLNKQKVCPVPHAGGSLNALYRYSYLFCFWV